MWDNINRFKITVNGMPEEKEDKMGRKKYFKKWLKFSQT